LRVEHGFDAALKTTLWTQVEKKFERVHRLKSGPATVRGKVDMAEFQELVRPILVNIPTTLPTPK
jgi:hypothetical protein